MKRQCTIQICTLLKHLIFKASKTNFNGESKRRNKGVGLEIPASYTFYYRKPSKIVIKFNLIGLIRDKEDKANL